MYKRQRVYVYEYIPSYILDFFLFTYKRQRMYMACANMNLVVISNKNNFCPHCLRIYVVEKNNHKYHWQINVMF